MVEREERPLSVKGRMESEWVRSMLSLGGVLCLHGLEGLLRSCRNDFYTPVLKHGPRSLPIMRVCGWKTHRRNESKSKVPKRKLAASAAVDLL